MRPRLHPYQIDDLRNLEQAFEAHCAVCYVARPVPARRCCLPNTSGVNCFAAVRGKDELIKVNHSGKGDVWCGVIRVGFGTSLLILKPVRDYLQSGYGRRRNSCVEQVGTALTLIHTRSTPSVWRRR